MSRLFEDLRCIYLPSNVVLSIFAKVTENGLLMELTTNHQMVQNNYSLYRQNCIFLRKITATNFLRKITASKFAPD